MASLPRIHVDEGPRDLTLTISGRLDARGISALWHQGVGSVQKAGTRQIRIQTREIQYLDMAGAAFIAHLKKVSPSPPELLGLKTEFSALVDLAERTRREKAAKPRPLTYIEETGRRLSRVLEDVTVFITFIGEITWAMASSLKRPRAIRWSDTLAVAEGAGANALPIVALISFIVGLVMAFQAAIPMKMFGAEIYVANLIGIAMVRELGPLMTAIVLAGRSASAFAAEIGTMKINEELDALTVMGVDPVKFLILPRIIAATLVTPLLTVFSNLVGILGGALVILSFGYPLVAYTNQVVNFVSWQDFTGGLVKAFVFGMIIAATGCIRGYQTLKGPSAVGDATTSAVVTSIILIAVFDGIFSVVYYYLGI